MGRGSRIIVKKSLVLTILLPLVFGLVMQTIAAADSLTISGLTFPVDKIAAVDADTVHLTLFGKEELVAKKSLESTVASRYLAQPERMKGFSFESLIDFVKDSIKQDAPERAAQALISLCSRSDDSHAAKLPDTLREIERSSAAPAFFRSAGDLLGARGCPSDVTAEILFRAGLGDRAWLRSSGLRLIFSNESALRRLVESRAYEAGREHAFDEMGQYIDFYSAAFGSEDARAQELRILFGKVSKAAEEVKGGDLDSLYSISETSKSEPWLNDIVLPMFVEELHTRAKRALTRKEADNALLILAHIDLKKRTPTTHELMRTALETLGPATNSVIAQPMVSSTLLAVSQADSSVKAAYISYLERLSSYLIQQGALDELSAYFGQLTQLRPDPNRDNDRIRLQQISAYIDRNMMLFARERMKYVQTGVPLGYKLRFAFAGFYFDPAYFIVLVAAPIGAAVVLLLIALIERVRRFAYERRKQKEQEQREEKEEVIEPFVRSGLVRSMSPSMIEYRECLAVFGLPAEADLKAIKTAYRQAVKEAHPDLSHQVDARASERFIELTKTYERILELHKDVKPVTEPETKQDDFS